MIRLLVLDVDGTMTDGGVYYDATGNELKKFAIKDGAGLVLGALGGSQQDIFLLAEDGRCAGALGVCRAALRVQPQSAQALAPCYLRLSQAERERAEKLARAGL